MFDEAIPETGHLAVAREPLHILGAALFRSGRDG
jgi:hypothetical protein